MNWQHTEEVKVTLTRDLSLFDIMMIGVGGMVGASAQGLFDQRVFGSIPETVARECTKTVIMTKRYWPLKSRLARVTESIRGEA